MTCQPVSRAQEWAERRLKGESVAAIAAAAGVSPATVSRATSERGPFPHPRSVRASLAQPAHPVQEWITLRRSGIGVAQIAADYGVSRQWVSRLTSGAGPFPNPKRKRQQAG